MNRLPLSLLLSHLLLLSAIGGEGQLLDRFEWKRPINGEFSEGDQGRIVVPSDVFGRAHQFPNDVRIFSEEGIQWPFFLHRASEAKTDTYVAWSVLNKSFVTGEEPYLQFDLQRPAEQDPASVHNRLELHTSGHDFVRRVEVYSAAGGQAGLLASGYLIDFSHQQDAQNRIVRYPNSDVDRLHVRVFPNAQAADETFDLISARQRHHAEQAVPQESVEAMEVELPKRDQVKGAQSYLYDLGEENRPVEFIDFELGDGSFARCVSVYGRNTERDRWVRVGGGGIHHLEGDKDAEIRIRARHRFLKVSIFHYDDQPLEVQAIRFSALPRYLIFEAATGGSAALFFRAWDVKAPRYDLTGRVDKETLSDLPLVLTGEAIPNLSAGVQTWRKYANLLASLAVGVVSLLVIWVIVSMLRRQALMDD